MTEEVQRVEIGGLLAAFKERHKDDAKAYDRAEGYIQARVLRLGDVTNPDLSKPNGIGEKTRQSVRLDDGTGAITLKLWREHVLAIQQLGIAEGKVIRLDNFAARKWTDEKRNKPHFELAVAGDEPKIQVLGDVSDIVAPSAPKESLKEEAEPGGPTMWDIKDKGASLGGCLHDAAAIMAACIQADWDWRMVVDGRPRTIAELDAEGLTLAEAVFELACRLEEQKATYIERWAAGGANTAEAPGELAPSAASKMPPAPEPPAALPTSPDEFYPMCCKAFGLDRTWVNQLLRLALSKLDGVPVEQGQLGKHILARAGTWAQAFQDLVEAGFDWMKLLDEAKAEAKSKAK